MLNKLHAMDRNFIFSGQLFLRYRSPAIELDMTTRDLFAVCGMIAVPKNVMKGEHQYTIAGYDSMTDGIILTIDRKGIDLKEKAKGMSIGSLLIDPIWKI